MSYSRNVFMISNLIGTLKEIVNCSQKPFVANIVILFLFFAIFCLADFSDPYDFRLQEREKEVAPSLHDVLPEPLSALVFKYAINGNCFGDSYLWCEGRFLEIDPTPPPTHRPHSSPPNPFCTPAALTLRPFN